MVDHIIYFMGLVVCVLTIIIIDLLEGHVALGLALGFVLGLGSQALAAYFWYRKRPSA